MNPGTFCGTCGAVTKQGALYCGSCGAPAPGPTAATPVPPPTMIGTVGTGAAPDPADAPPFDAPGAGPAEFTGCSTFGRRVGAYLLDALPPVLFVLAGYPALIAAVFREPGPPLWLAFLFLGALPLAYVVVLWAMAARGSSPGNALLGIRVVRESTGAPPGVGLGLGRLLLRSLILGVTLYVAGFSPLWDGTGRRRGWWDSACGTVVLNRDALDSYRAKAGRPEPPSLAAMSLGGLPAGDSAGDERPAWDLPPVAPIPRPGPAAAAVPTASWGDRPADPAAVPSPSGPAAPDLPWSKPPPASEVIQAVPGVVRAPEPAEHTRLKVTAEPAPSTAAGWLAALDDGRTLTLAGPVILGRDPIARSEEHSAVTVPIADDGRSVSKTHLRLDVGSAGVAVTDRHSTNGVVVVTAGVELRCVPGVATPVPEGSIVRFGDRSLAVRRT
jgi:uncharacterized RDD family membrane protein YckC